MPARKKRTTKAAKQSGLNDKQLRFVDEYMRYPMATEAYRRAFVLPNKDPKNIHRLSSEMRRNAKVSEEIERRQEEWRREMRDAFEAAKRQMIDIMLADITEAPGHCIAAFGKDGPRLWDKHKAFEYVSKMVGEDLSDQQTININFAMDDEDEEWED